MHADGSVRFTGRAPRVWSPGAAWRNQPADRAAGRSPCGHWHIASDPRVKKPGHACLVQRLDGLQLDRKRVLDPQVHEVVADHHVPWSCTLAAHCCTTDRPAARTAKADAFSWTFSRNPAPGASSTPNAQPIICPDRSFSRSLSACIGVHRLASSASKFLAHMALTVGRPRRAEKRSAFRRRTVAGYVVGDVGRCERLARRWRKALRFSALRGRPTVNAIRAKFLLRGAADRWLRTCQRACNAPHRNSPGETEAMQRKPGAPLMRAAVVERQAFPAPRSSHRQAGRTPAQR